MRALFVTLSVFVLSSVVFAKKDPVLMTINNEPVTQSEFEYIYNKNNSNNVLDKKTLDEYVDLFINFKLKVQEAKAQGIDTTASFIKELKGYRDQLTKPYLTDSEAEKAVLQEAYDRLKEDLDVSHILIRVDEHATPEDTLAAWNKVQAIKQRLKTEDFAEVAKEVSEDETAKESGGHIGWITGFQTIYPFETKAYNTPVGGVSEPVRTIFGYHIVKVLDRRPSLGEVLVQHIMKFTDPYDEALSEKAKVQIDSLYQLVEQGADFGKVASEFSDDRASAMQNGELPWFGTRRMVAEFEQAAFALKNIGDVSEPILSPYGWHIIKLIDKKSMASFEDKKSDIERNVKRDDREHAGERAFVAGLKKAYKFKTAKGNPEKDFIDLLQDRNLSDSAFIADASAVSWNKAMFSFAKKKYNQQDFLNYLNANPYSQKASAGEIINEKLNKFISKELLAYEDSQLENKHTDFRLLMNEYHDGILLFEVSNEEVWEKASKDTEGLASFFKRNQSKYNVWKEPHFKGFIIQCDNKEILDQAKAIAASQPTDSIDKHLRQLNDSVVHVKVNRGLYVKGDNKLVDHYHFRTTEEFKIDEKFPYTFVHGNEINKPEEYTDVRGLVTADYQEYLEKEWINYLRNKYPFKVNQKVLNKIRKN